MNTVNLLCRKSNGAAAINYASGSTAVQTKQTTNYKGLCVAFMSGINI